MEGAARVFAGEFSRSTLSVPSDDKGGIPWIVTPGGAWCRLIYCAGALTEIADSGDLIRCRVADPSGGFDLVTGGRNTALAETFRKIPVPSFVSVTGQAQMYQKDHHFHLSIRPDHIRTIDRSVRDRIALGTAESTLVRLEQMHLTLQGKCSDPRIMSAYRHYSVTTSMLEELLQMVDGAVRSIQPAGDNLPQEQPDARGLVRELIQAKGGPRGIAVGEIVETASLRGVPQDAVLSAIESLILGDECYQPQKGFVKLL